MAETTAVQPCGFFHHRISWDYAVDSIANYGRVSLLVAFLPGAREPLASGGRNSVPCSQPPVQHHSVDNYSAVASSWEVDQEPAVRPSVLSETQ